MWASGKSSSFRRIDRAAAGAPMIATRSGGVVARQTSLIRARSTKAETPATTASVTALDAEGHPARPEFQHDRHGRCSENGPQHQLRRLVDRQMPKRPLIAIVEPEQLRDHDPERKHDQRPGELSCLPVACEKKREARKQHGGDIRKSQQSTQQRVAPDAGSPPGPCTDRPFGGGDIGCRRPPCAPCLDSWRRGLPHATRTVTDQRDGCGRVANRHPTSRRSRQRGVVIGRLGSRPCRSVSRPRFQESLKER